MGSNAKGIFALIGLGVIAVVGLFAALGSWFTIDQGDRGVVLRNGRYMAVASPGLNFKWPVFESVEKLSVRTHAVTYKNLGSYSRDIQLAQLRVTVNYHIDPSRVGYVYEKYGSVEAAVDRILTPRIQDNVKEAFGQFNAQSAIADRNALGQRMEDIVRKNAGNFGLIVDSVQLEEIDFSKEFEKSIEARMQAEVEVARLRQNLEREKVQADIKRTQANGAADATRAEAQAAADAIRMRGDAEAKAIRARAEALRENASLIELVKAERWNGALPTTMLPNSATPLLQVK